MNLYSSLFNKSPSGIDCEGEKLAEVTKFENGDTSEVYVCKKNGVAVKRHTYADGSLRYGTWKNGNKDGIIYHYDCDGRRTREVWKENKRLSKFRLC